MAAVPKDPKSGHPGHLTPEQESKLQAFKDELTAEGLYDPAKFDDPYLLRFLRARKFDLPKSKLMWSDFIKWRTNFNVDELYKSFDYQEIKEVDKYYPQFYHKTDKDGRPVYIEILGKIDVGKLYQVTTAERQLQRLVVEYERFIRDRLPVCSQIKGHLVETSCTILDLKGVGVSQFWKVKDFVQSTANVSSNNYPETMGKFYIINAPWAFTTVWSFVKPWLDEVTVSKIQILGSDYLKVLAQQIPIENIPKFIGGGCQCPEGCTLSNAGPWQDEELVKQVQAKRITECGVSLSDVNTGEGASNTRRPAAGAGAPAAATTAAVAGTGAAATASASQGSGAEGLAAGKDAEKSDKELEVEPETPATLTSNSSSVKSTVPTISTSTADIHMTTVESKVDA